jgi:glycosyltransferase involved in cell wall biosynthesis
MVCLFDTRWIGDNGIGRFAREISNRLPHQPMLSLGHHISPLDPFRSALIRQKNTAGDWIFSPGMNGPLFGNLPFVLTIHDLNHLDRAENSSYLKRAYYKTVVWKLCQRARAIFTVSKFSRNRIIDWFGVAEEKVFNVGNGVSSAFYSNGPAISRDHPYIISVSNRKGHKNEDRLLEAFASSAVKDTHHLVLTGDASEKIMAVAKTLCIAKQLFFTGKISEEALASYYRGATCLVFPSLYEGFGLPVIEAFACGTPVITSNVAALPEISGGASLLVDPNSTHEITVAINRMTADHTLRLSYVEHGLIRAREFSWNSVVTRIRLAIDNANSRSAAPLKW